MKRYKFCFYVKDMFPHGSFGLLFTSAPLHPIAICSNSTAWYWKRIYCLESFSVLCRLLFLSLKMNWCPEASKSSSGPVSLKIIVGAHQKIKFNLVLLNRWLKIKVLSWPVQGEKRLIFTFLCEMQVSVYIDWLTDWSGVWWVVFLVVSVFTVCQGLQTLHAVHWNWCYCLLLAVGCQQHKL